jgi:hypothetical protein
MSRGGAWSALVLSVGLSGCVYYNAMWSAERHAKDARAFEQRGQLSDARSAWAQAAEKAGNVALRHPRSHWADDALALEAEGLARSGACDEAADPISRVRASVTDAALRERVELAAAECAIAAAHPLEADRALAVPLKSKDAGRRSRAEYLAGASAALQLDYGAAAAHFARSQDPVAVAAHARALLGAGETREAAVVIDALPPTTAFEIDRADLLARLAAVGGPETASRALDKTLARGRLAATEQARLLLADADRRLDHGDYDVASARFRQAMLVAPVGTMEAGLAQVGLVRVRVSRAATREELVPVVSELTQLGNDIAAAEARRLLDLVHQASALPETPGARLRAAEIARDSLNAPVLAGQLFLDVAAADTGSLYAPKALIAALPLLPARRDSIARTLDSRYAASPYTRAFHGEVSAGYEAAEDSLAHELGIAVAAAPAPVIAHVELPVPGPRGPLLDDTAGLTEHPLRGRPGVRPNAPPNPRERPVQPDRP